MQGSLPEGSAPPCVVINGKALTFSFALDALEVTAQLSRDFLPPLPNDKVRCDTASCICMWRWRPQLSCMHHCPLEQPVSSL